MSALWTPGRAGVSPGFLVEPGASVTGLPQAGLLHEGRDLLANGCAYCTKSPPTWSTPDPPPAAPHPRAVRPDDAGSQRSDRGSFPLRQAEAQLSHLADAPKR